MGRECNETGSGIQVEGMQHKCMRKGREEEESTTINVYGESVHKEVVGTGEVVGRS